MCEPSCNTGDVNWSNYFSFNFLSILSHDLFPGRKIKIQLQVDC